MGSSFRRCKSKQEWEVQWKKVKQFPNEEIDQVLRTSYYGLGKNEKDIFLDIACFLKGYERNLVNELLDSRDFHGEAGINDLIDRSLISISKWNIIEMHDFMQEMGRAIAREQRSRLLNADDVYQVLTNNQRDGHVQAISFDLAKIEELEHASFGRMYRLRYLHVSEFSFRNKDPLIVSLDLPNSLRYFYWKRYPLESLPSKFSVENLLFLNLSSREVGAQLWNEDQGPVNLKWIILRGCRHLTKVPNLSRSIKIEYIDLRDCQNLVEIPSYFQHLDKLTYLHLGSCENLKNLPEMPCNLEFLDLSWTAIEELPSSVWSHEKISYLTITFCQHLKSLPSNTCKLKLSRSFSLKGCVSLCEFWELPTNTIGLDYCKSLVSLPTKIWKLKSLKSIDLSFCSNFQYFPEISEAVEHVESLNLSYTSVKELPPSIGNLVALRKLDLCFCNNLVSLPTNISKLKSLESIDLMWCSKFQYFPEISEVVEHLTILNLSGTSVKELPPSIGNLVALRNLDLSHCRSLLSLPTNIWKLKSLKSLDLNSCESLLSLPTNIWKLKSLKSLDLGSCSNFQYFPEISEAVEHLESLNLSCTSVKELPPSIGNLVALRKLDLCCCNNLVSLPTNIWKLKSLKSLDLQCCFKFQHFPEISEAVEHLESLNLSHTTVKELPPSIGNLVALRNLDLSHCESLVNFNSCSKFQYCPEFKSLPASIKQVTQLSHLCLINCKSLESLPELPPSLQHLEASGCTSLKTVSSSSIAITQGWEEYIFCRGLHEKHIFSNCPLDENARSSIMADAQLRIMRMATASKFIEDEIEESLGEVSFFAIICPGNEIPNWFSHKSKGCSIKIELPRDWFSTDFLGFALSLVVATIDKERMTIGCKYNFKTSNGESHEVNHRLYCPGSESLLRNRNPHEVWVWWYNNVFEEVVEGAQSPTAFYKLVTEVNVDFTLPGYYRYKPLRRGKCGICLLYGKDAEMIKQRALYA